MLLHWHIVMLLGRYILMFLLVVFDARDCAPERNMAGFLMDREVQLSLQQKTRQWVEPP